MSSTCWSCSLLLFNVIFIFIVFVVMKSDLARVTRQEHSTAAVRSISELRHIAARDASSTLPEA